MATENPLLVLAGQLAGEDMGPSSGLTGYGSSGLYLLAKMSADNTVVHCNAVGDSPIGIIQGDPANGDGCPVTAYGVSKVMAGGTMVAGDFYGPNAAGRAVKKNMSATGADFGNFVLGQVLVGAAAGELATVTVGPCFRC